jgi:hypothetical protein
VAVIIDSSNSNMGFGRAIELQDSLLVWTYLNQSLCSVCFLATSMINGLT